MPSVVPSQGTMIASSDIKLYKSLASLIKEYREWRHLSQETFAESIGISVRELRYWEANRRCARIDSLHDLSEATGIPMKVCIALNVDQPVWYSLQKRLYAYSSLEAKFLFHDLFRYYQQPADNNLLKCERILTDKHIDLILSCHREKYCTEKPLERRVIKAASMILPDLNHIDFDIWGHYVGHTVCLPIKKEVYQQLKGLKVLEDYLTTERLSDIYSLHEGVLFYYSGFAIDLSVAHRIWNNDMQSFSKIKQKERYLLAVPTALKEAEEFYNQLGMRREMNYECMHPEGLTKLYEIELDVLMRLQEPCARVLGENDGSAESKNMIGKAKRERLSIIATKRRNNDGRPDNHDVHLSVGDMSLSVDKHQPGNEEVLKNQIHQLKRETCQNPECTLHDKASQGNIISNGTYQTKNGILSQRFLCKECGKSFSDRKAGIFYGLYGLRSPEEKILTALKFLVKGISLRAVAMALEVNPHTVRHWLKVAAKQSEKIDAMLIRELKVSQADLDVLWDSIKTNSLRQRANRWKSLNITTSKKSYLPARNSMAKATNLNTL